jgi:hypothetical protein
VAAAPAVRLAVLPPGGYTRGQIQAFHICYNVYFLAFYME